MKLLPALLVLLVVGCGVRADVAAGQAALDRGDLPAAEAAWRRALDREPDHPEALYGLGWTWHLGGEADRARSAFDQLVAAHPESPLGYKGLGSVAMAEGNPTLAERRFEEALARAPEDLAVRHSLALLALSLGRAEEALTALDALIAEAPDRPELHQARAEALLRLGREEDALVAADAAVAAGGAPRVQVQARTTRARALVAVTAGRVRSEACAETAPPVYAWLEEADRTLDVAEAFGIRVPELVEARRMVRRRRAGVDDLCPGLRAGGVGKEFPDG